MNQLNMRLSDDAVCFFRFMTNEDETEITPTYYLTGG